MIFNLNQVSSPNMVENTKHSFVFCRRYTLPESVPVGTTVLSVSAKDSDSGINGQFRYHVDDPHFQVNPYTGEISTVKPLDFETSRSHIFDVVAKDGGMPVLTGTARVEVTLGNVNDNPPRFLKPMYNEYVNEDAGPGELVTTGTTQLFADCFT